MIEALNTEHGRYRDRKDMWRRYWDFYVGGEQMRRNAGQYLTRRQKEPNDVYAERLGRVFYENYLGSCVDWYAAALFRAEPRIAVETADSKTRKFYAEFIGDCDCRGTTLMATARRFADRGYGVLAVLHDPNLAATYADRICVLDRGRVVAEGAPEDVMTEALFASAFGVRVTMLRHPGNGRPVMLPA